MGALVMNDEAGIPEVSVILTIGLMLVVFGTFVVSWLIVLMTAGVFWRTPLPQKLADQIRLGLSVLFDTRARLTGPARTGREGHVSNVADSSSAFSRHHGTTLVS